MKLCAANKGQAMAQVGSSSSSVVVETEAETVASSSSASEHAAAALNSTTAGHEVLETWTLVVDQFYKYASQKQFEKFLADLDVGHHKAVKVPNRDMAFAVFRDRAKFDAAMVTIGAASFKGKPLSVFEKTGSAKFERKKRDRDNDRDAGGDGQKRQRDDKNSDGGDSRVKKTGKEATSPWHDVEYKDQLARKEKSMRQEALLPLLRGIKKTYTKPRDGSVRMTPAYLAGMLDQTWAGVHVESIVESPQKVGYRNKCEFTFGNDSTGARSLGFRISSFDEGVMVDPPRDAPTVPAAMRAVVDAMIQFVRGSALAPYDLKTHEGVWRLCTIRYSRRTRDLHVLLCVKLADVDADMWAREVARLAAVLELLRRDATTDVGDDADDAMYGVGVDGLGTHLVTGCGYQAYDGASVAPTDLTVHSVLGRPSVRETLLGAAFEIAPTAFFQVNTPVAERLYSRAIHAMLAQTNGAAPVSETVLLDVCSGTGTIGILAALAAQGRLQLTNTAAPADEIVSKVAAVTHVIGVEMCDPAVSNSVTNAQLNNLKAYDTPATVADGSGGTVSFVSGRAEKVLPKLLSGSTKDFEEALSGSSCSGLAVWLRPRLKKARAQAGGAGLRVCAIVDPAREGLHPDCLKAIRACPLITRLVYISCNPTKSLVRDGESLCMPASKKWAGEAFKPVRSCPVDLFPMSPHCELVVVFERESTLV